MRRKIKYVVLAVILLLVGFCFYMETHFSSERFVKENVTQEEILQEFPEIAVSEKDIALEQYVLALPEVQEMLKQAENSEFSADIEEKEAERLLSPYMGEDWSVIELSAIKDARVYVSFSIEHEKRIYYSFSPNGEYPMTKTIGVLEMTGNGEEVREIYSNLNGEIEKLIPQRVWFAWLKELLENGSHDNKLFS